VGNFKAVRRYREGAKEESCIAMGQLAFALTWFWSHEDVDVRTVHVCGCSRVFTPEMYNDFFVYVAMPCAHDDFAHGNRCFAAVLQVGVETQGDFL
jgi:hypothetical protein